MKLQAHVDLSTVPLGARIDPKIYGHFLESAFFGNIEGGVYEEGSALSYTDGPLQGCRVDVLEACAQLGIQLTLDGRATLPPTAVLRELGTGTDDLFAVNTIDDDARVVLSQPRNVDLGGGGLTLAPHSISLLTLTIGLS